MFSLVTLDENSYAVILPPVDPAGESRDTDSISTVDDHIPDLRDSDVASFRRVKPDILHLVAPRQWQ